MNEETTTKLRLIEVAIDLFSANGFKGTSIRDIAKAMNMSIAGIYHYFGSKEGLFLEILESGSRHVIEGLRKVVELDMDPLERFKLLVTTHLHLISNHMKEGKVFFLDDEVFSPKAVEINRGLQNEVFSIYKKAMKDVEKAGHFGKRNPSVIALNMLGVMNWYLRWYRAQGPLSKEKAIDEIVHFVFYGSLGAAKDDAIRQTPPRKRAGNKVSR
jgi:TetR/AcrR family transcriptional regulator, cholesterol catabolism regulator